MPNKCNKVCLRCSTEYGCKCLFNFLHPELDLIFPNHILKKLNRYVGTELFTDKYCRLHDPYKNTLYRYYVPINRRSVTIRKKHCSRYRYQCGDHICQCNCKIEIPKRDDLFLESLLKKTIQILTDWHYTNLYSNLISDLVFDLPAHKIYKYLVKSRLKELEKKLINLQYLPSNFDSKVRVYAMNYNVMRIMSGCGGLAYSC